MNKRHSQPRNVSPKCRKLESISSSFGRQVKDNPSFLKGQPIVATGLWNFSFFASGQRNAFLQKREGAIEPHQGSNSFVKKVCNMTFSRRLQYDSFKKFKKASIQLKEASI